MGPGASAQRTNMAERLSALIPMASAMYGKNLFFMMFTGQNKIHPILVGWILSFLLAQIIAQFPADGWMAQSAQRLRFDLSHALAGDAHLASHFFEGVRLPVEQSVTQL